ncbi:MAG: flagellar export chaperone FlgN [Verrucomicrobiota bacterium]
MNDALDKLITALREELQQCGEMLARLDQQQDHVTRRAADELLQSTAEIEVQSKVLHESRRARTDCQQSVARELGLAGDANFAEIIPQLPGDYRPLLSALVQENNESLLRVHQRSRQNHVLMCRSLELMSRLLGGLLPGSATVYTDKGGLLSGTFPAHAMYQAIG